MTLKKLVMICVVGISHKANSNKKYMIQMMALNASNPNSLRTRAIKHARAHTQTHTITVGQNRNFK